MAKWFRRFCAVTVICWILSTTVFGEEETAVPRDEWWSDEGVLERLVNTAVEASLIPPASDSSPLTSLVESAIRQNTGDRGDDFVTGGRESHHRAQQFSRRQGNEPSEAGGSQLFPPIIHEGYIKGYERSPLDPRPREPIEGPQGPPNFESHRLQQQQQQAQHQENLRQQEEQNKQQHQENLRQRQQEEQRRQQLVQQERLRQEQQQQEQRRQQQLEQERLRQQHQKIQDERLRQQQQELQRQQQLHDERLRQQQQLEKEQQQQLQREQLQIQEEQRRRQQLEQQELQRLQKQREEQRRQQEQNQNRFQSQDEDNRRNPPVRDSAATDAHHQAVDTSRPFTNTNFQNQHGQSQQEQVSRNDQTTSVDLNAQRVPSFVSIPNESQEIPSLPVPTPIATPSLDVNKNAPKPGTKPENSEDTGFPPFPISTGDFTIDAEVPKEKDQTFLSTSDKKDFVAKPPSVETFSEETIPFPPTDEVTELQSKDYVTDSVQTSSPPPLKVPEKIVIVEHSPSSFPTNRPGFATTGEKDLSRVQLPEVVNPVVDQKSKEQAFPETKQQEFIVPDNALPPNQFPDIPVPVLPPLQRPESHPPLTFPVFPSVSQIQPPAEVQPVPFIDLSGNFDFPLIQSCSPTLWRDKNSIRGRSLKEIANLVGAGNFFALASTVESLLEQIVGSGPYTLFLPSNEALLRLPKILLDSWCRDDGLMASMLRNHVVKARLSLDDLRQTALLDSSSPGGVLHLRNNRNETISVNGQRISVADIDGPDKGIIHVLDGFLYPITNRNILQTLAECRRYDGFLSLLHAAQLTDVLRTRGITVFVPSNAALSKLSQEEHQYIRRDPSTLREFLLYHIVNGIYFSSDVKEGYYLPTFLENRSVRIGTRTDGCYRRMQEANNSPFHRTDIPATNGVIHILDWVLKPSDLDSCENFCLP